jgi:hypothetical protein
MELKEKMEQNKNKKFDKTRELVSIDTQLWEEFSSLRQPFGTINELFEDCIRVLLGHQPKHIELLKRFKQVVPTIPEELV